MSIEELIHTLTIEELEAWRCYYDITPFCPNFKYHVPNAAILASLSGMGYEKALDIVRGDYTENKNNNLLGNLVQELGG